jgi:DinB superfamily
MEESHATNRRAAELAAIVDRATDDLLQLVRECPADFWRSSPEPDDPRPVGVIVHHVGVSQLDVADWIRKVLRGERLHLTPEVVHAANAAHAEEFRDVSAEAAAEIVEASGREVAQLLRGLTDAEMDAELPRDGGGGYRVDRFAEIAGRHPVTHATAIRRALATWSTGAISRRAAPSESEG